MAGVDTAADFLTRPITELTSAAEKAGLKVGMHGAEALELIKAHAAAARKSRL